MSVLVTKVGRSGAGKANADYITRLSGAEAIAFHNLDQLKSDDIYEARTNAIAYAQTREDVELAKGKRVGPKIEKSFDKTSEQKKGIKQQKETSESQNNAEESVEPVNNRNGKEKTKLTKEKQIRTHYRLIASWVGKEESEKAVEEVKKYLQKEFPKARAVIAIHQDTDDTHAHVWIDARQTDGKKIHLKNDEFKSLDEKWTKQYDQTYGTNFAPEYKALKLETTRWKRDMYKWRKAIREKVEGAELIPKPVKPLRAADRFSTDYWREKEVAEFSKANIGGIGKYEEINAGTGYSDAQGDGGFAQKTKHAIDRTRAAIGRECQPAERTKSTSAPAINNAGKLAQSDNNYQVSTENDGTRLIENRGVLSFDDEENTSDLSRSGGTPKKISEEQSSQPQSFRFRSGSDQADGIRFINSGNKDFSQNSTIGENSNLADFDRLEIWSNANDLTANSILADKNAEDFIKFISESRGLTELNKNDASLSEVDLMKKINENLIDSINKGFESLDDDLGNQAGVSDFTTPKEFNVAPSNDPPRQNFSVEDPRDALEAKSEAAFAKMRLNMEEGIKRNGVTTYEEHHKEYEEAEEIQTEAQCEEIIEIMRL